VVCLVQKLDLSMNFLTDLPAHLSGLAGLQTLLVQSNRLTAVPVPVLLGMTAIQDIDLFGQQAQAGGQNFTVAQPLHPIFHPRLKVLDLRQQSPFGWDPVSLFHLGRALAEISDRDPVPVLQF
jgi:Leucine-rich repeat (LRR) protein